MKNKRIEWLDVLKYICIIMVMLSHLESATDLLRTFFSPFFLSAFFFASGYVYKQKDDFKEFLYKKYRQLFVPWLIFSVFNILLAQIISFNEHDSFWNELKWNFLQIRGLEDEIWFVAALFVAYIPFYFFIKRYERKTIKLCGGNKCLAIAILIAWILSLVSIMYSRLMPAEIFPWNSSALPWHIEYMFQAMFYMVLGYIFRQQFEGWFDKYNKLQLRMIVWVIYLLLVFIPYATEIGRPIIIDVLYGYLTALVGIVAVVSTSKSIKTNKYINYVGQNTLIYFALHGKIYSVIQTVLKRCAGNIYSMILENVLASSVFALVFALALSVVLMIPAYIFNRWFPFVLGRK